MTRNRLIHRAAIAVAFAALTAAADMVSAARQKPESRSVARPDFGTLSPARVPRHDWDIILGKPTDSTVTVSLLSYKDIQAYLEYGTAPGKYDQKSESCSLKINAPREIRLSNLKPDCRYYYRMQYKMADRTEFSPTGEFVFHTQRKPGSSFVFAVQADPHIPKESNDPYPETLGNVLKD